MFNTFFAIYTLSNSNENPTQQEFLIGSRLDEDEDSLKMIRHLNMNKANGCNDNSIRMLKICDYSIVKPLSILFCSSCHGRRQM